MPLHKAVQRKVWTKCDICGFEYPVEQLVNQEGFLKCSKCRDNLLVQERPQIIAEVLSDGEEFLDVVGERRAEPTEIPEL